MQTENPFLYNLLTPYDQIKFVNAFKTGLKILGMVSIFFNYSIFQIYSLAISLLWTPKFTKKMGVLLGYVYVEDRKRMYIKYLTVTYLTSLSLEVNKIGKKNWVLGVQWLPLL